MCAGTSAGGGARGASPGSLPWRAPGAPARRPRMRSSLSETGHSPGACARGPPGPARRRLGWGGRSRGALQPAPAWHGTGALRAGPPGVVGRVLRPLAADSAEAPAHTRAPRAARPPAAAHARPPRAAAILAPVPPNIVLIVADDLGYGDLGCFGNPDVQTPVLDRLAEGLRLTQHYSGSAVCAPARARCSGATRTAPGPSTPWRGGGWTASPRGR